MTTSFLFHKLLVKATIPFCENEQKFLLRRLSTNLSTIAVERML